MEGNCQQTAVDVFYIYNVSHVLGKVWNSLGQDHRQETIGRLRDRVADLNDKGQVRHQDANKMFETLDKADEYNKEIGIFAEVHRLTAFRTFLDHNSMNLAIHAIADCECVRP